MSYIYVKSLNHLNITWAVVVIGLNVVFVVADVSTPVATLIGLATTFPLTFWVLRNKSRSGWWVFLAWLGSPLWLKNKSELLDEGRP